MPGSAVIEALRASAYAIPTDRTESDGTLEWDHTTLVLAEVRAGGREGLGYSYTSSAAVRVIDELLRPCVLGLDALAIPRAWMQMRRAVRNVGQSGIAATAISAVDIALWDLKAKLLELPLVGLLGSVRDAVTLYGSGGFTSYDEATLRQQLGAWAEQGFRAVKMKIGRDAAADLQRTRAARDAIGPRTALFVDANGGYDRKLALAQAEAFARVGVSWFEEPVSSDDLPGLRLLRDRAPAGMQIAAGEYGYDPVYFRRMLEAGAVDVLQADVTRCQGISGFRLASALALSHGLALSCHCAPALHVHLGCALEPICHLEYFHDHVRIEHMLFEGCPAPRAGQLSPDRARPGLGLRFRREAAEAFAIDAPRAA